MCIFNNINISFFISQLSSTPPTPNQDQTKTTEIFHLNMTSLHVDCLYIQTVGEGGVEVSGAVLGPEAAAADVVLTNCAAAAHNARIVKPYSSPSLEYFQKKKHVE